MVIEKHLIIWLDEIKIPSGLQPSENGSHMQLYTYLNSVTKRLTWLWMKRKKYLGMSISWQVANHSLLLTPLGICFLTGWPGSRSVHVAHETEMRLMKRIIKYRGLNIFHDVENTYYMKMALHQFVASQSLFRSNSRPETRKPACIFMPSSWLNLLSIDPLCRWPERVSQSVSTRVWVPDLNLITRKLYRGTRALPV